MPQIFRMHFIFVRKPLRTKYTKIKCIQNILDLQYTSCHVRVCVCVCADMCMCVRACMRVCACVRACTRACVRACVHACVRTCLCQGDYPTCSSRSVQVHSQPCSLCVHHTRKFITSRLQKLSGCTCICKTKKLINVIYPWKVISF